MRVTDAESSLLVSLPLSHADAVSTTDAIVNAIHQTCRRTRRGLLCRIVCPFDHDYLEDWGS